MVAASRTSARPHLFPQIISRLTEVSRTRVAELAKLSDYGCRKAGILLTKQFILTCRRVRVMREVFDVAGSAPFGFIDCYSGHHSISVHRQSIHGMSCRRMRGSRPAS